VLPKKERRWRNKRQWGYLWKRKGKKLEKKKFQQKKGCGRRVMGRGGKSPCKDEEGEGNHAKPKVFEEG